MIAIKRISFASCCGASQLFSVPVTLIISASPSLGLSLVAYLTISIQARGAVRVGQWQLCYSLLLWRFLYSTFSSPRSCYTDKNTWHQGAVNEREPRAERYMRSSEIVSVTRSTWSSPSLLSIKDEAVYLVLRRASWRWRTAVGNFSLKG